MDLLDITLLCIASTEIKYTKIAPFHSTKYKSHRNLKYAVTSPTEDKNRSEIIWKHTDTQNVSDLDDAGSREDPLSRPDATVAIGANGNVLQSCITH